MTAGVDAVSAALPGWDGVYTLIGGMAATLTGLLFVALSINVRTIMSDSQSALRRSAIGTFNQFLLIIEVSIVMLVPGQTTVTLGVTIILLAAFALGITVSLTRTHAGGVSRWSLVSGNLLFLLYMAVGVLILVISANALFLLLSVVIAALINSVFGAWALLVEVGQDDDSAAQVSSDPGNAGGASS